MSSRDVEDLMAERGISVSYESIRLWCIRFGSRYAKRLRGRHQGYGDTFYLDEVFVRIQGVQHYLWRAIDQDGEAIQVYSSGATISEHPRSCLQFIQSGAHSISAKHYRFFRARSLPLGYNEPLRLGNVQLLCRAMANWKSVGYET
jgi:hypothetical protein